MYIFKTKYQSWLATTHKTFVNLRFSTFLVCKMGIMIIIHKVVVRVELNYKMEEPIGQRD